MSTTELKNKVLKKIQGIEEHFLLEEVLALLEFETNPEPFKLSKEQILAIDEAREQIKRGETYTNSEVEEEIDQWL